MKMTVMKSVKATPEAIAKFGVLAHWTNPSDQAWSIRRRMEDFGWKYLESAENRGSVSRKYHGVLVLHFEAES